MALSLMECEYLGDWSKPGVLIIKWNVKKYLGDRSKSGMLIIKWHVSIWEIGVNRVCLLSNGMLSIWEIGVNRECLLSNGM